MLSEDKLELISGCSQLSLKGKHQVAAGMLQDWRKRTTETSAMKEFNKRQKKTETRLKHEAEMDQGLFIARQLGQESSMLSGAQHQGARLQWGPGLQAGNPPSYPTSGYPSYPPLLLNDLCQQSWLPRGSWHWGAQWAGVPMISVGGAGWRTLSRC